MLLIVFVGYELDTAKKKRTKTNEGYGKRNLVLYCGMCIILNCAHNQHVCAILLERHIGKFKFEYV